MGYLGVVGETVAEKTIERSHFLAYCARTAGEEEAKAFLSSVRARHPLATHVCYGYVADALGNIQRFSDDGEPQGTAGLPILGAVKAQKLYETAIAVVRYFGGIKLGAGGLVRAYTSVAAESAAAAEKRLYEECEKIGIAVGYGEVGACLRALEARGANILEREFHEGARFTVAVRTREAEGFISDLLGMLSGRVKIERGEKSVFPFPL